MRFTIAVLVGAALGHAICGCSEKAPVEPPGTPPVPPEAILVWFSEVGAPASIDSADTLTVRLSGVAGPNLCYSFDHLEATRTTSTVEITGHGLYDKSAIACPLAIPTFENVEQVVLPPFPVGPFRVVARQPDGSQMERSVNVGPPR